MRLETRFYDTYTDAVGEFSSVHFQRPALRFLQRNNAYFPGLTQMWSEIGFHCFLNSQQHLPLSQTNPEMPAVDTLAVITPVIGLCL